MDIREFVGFVREGNNLVIEYRNNRFVCFFKHGEVKESRTSAILSSEFGTGILPNNALKGYINKIRGKYLVFFAGDIKKRYEVQIPTKLFLGRKRI